GRAKDAANDSAQGTARSGRPDRGIHPAWRRRRRETMKRTLATVLFSGIVALAGWALADPPPGDPLDQPEPPVRLKKKTKMPPSEKAETPQAEKKPEEKVQPDSKEPPKPKAKPKPKEGVRLDEEPPEEPEQPGLPEMDEQEILQR